MTIAGECSGIDDFPQAYSYLDTPYPDTDFPTEVREACLRRSAVGADVRAAKVIVVGDVSVGKTCLITKFCHEVYDANYKATIGVDFEVEKFSVLHVPFSLQIWDTAGQERFRSITSAYYRGAQEIGATGAAAEDQSRPSSPVDDRSGPPGVAMCVEFVLFVQNLGALVRATVASLSSANHRTMVISEADDSRAERSSRETPTKVKES
ncbi:hypothetical protein ISCGN_009506 [Ixodes scapularis]